MRVFPSQQKRNAVHEHPFFSFRRDAAHVLLYAFLLCFFVESLSRRSPWSALGFLVLNPSGFLFNALIIACTLSVALIIRRRVYVYTLLFSLWTALGIISFTLGGIRMTPMSFYDIILFLNNLSITTAYLTILELILVVILALTLIGLLVLLYMRAPAVKPSRSKAVQFSLSLCALTLSISIPYASIHQDYTNPIEAYKSYGFAYSLLRTAVDRGITEPEEYNQEIVDHILADVTDEENAPIKQIERPNFIFLQLESFFDPANIATVQCSEDPIPTFTRLKKECASGYLQVPSIGGGTANVEFEVLTGMRLNDFGTGEYPYTSILQSRTCETIAHDLKEYGYCAHAIHNHTATFYDRHLVYPQLGFDTFTPLEYMQNYDVNALGWCHDDVLTGCILDALNCTAQKDLIFTISVQGHGNYSAEAPETPYPITSTGLEDDEKLKNEFEYYINTLRETDLFLNELIQALEDWHEPVVLVAYGDHLPALSFNEDALHTKDHLLTEYIIWSNDQRIEKQQKNVTAYQLTAHTMALCDISTGTLMRYHQQRAEQSDYLDELSVLEYDMLYGENLHADDAIPYPPADMQIGIREISLQNATLHGDLLIAKGTNFTRHSVLCANAHALTTQYIDAETLIATLTLLSNAEADDMITVAQISTDGTELGHSNPVICQLADP